LRNILTAENFIIIIKFLKLIIINSALSELENIIINIKINYLFNYYHYYQFLNLFLKKNRLYILKLKKLQYYKYNLDLIKF
jgi:hypothetical protein